MSMTIEGLTLTGMSPWAQTLPGWQQANGEAQHYFEITGEQSVRALCGLMALRKSLKTSNAVRCSTCRLKQTTTGGSEK